MKRRTTRLGSLLLGRLTRTGPSSRARRKKPGRRAASGAWGVGARSPDSGFADQRATRPETSLAAPPVAAPPAVRDEPTALSTRQLIRPDDRLKASIEAFLLDQRSPHTRRSYAQDIRRFLKFLLLREETQGLARIDRAAVVAHKEFLISEGLEHTTVDRHLATLRSFFQWLVDDGLLPKSPAESVRFLNPKRVSRTIGFSNEEVRRVLGGPNPHTRTGALHYAVLAVLFYCGLRRAELCALRRSNLSSERGQAIFRLRGKGDVERIVALPAPVVQALEHYLKMVPAGDEDGPLFAPIRNNRTGVAEKSLDPSMIYYIVRRYALRAGVESRVSPHSCRATAISNARDHHAPDRAIQEFAGWSTPAMITRYDKRRTAAESSASLSISYAEPEKG